jgi:polyhydroxybutyrate depolymerase
LVESEDATMMSAGVMPLELPDINLFQTTPGNDVGNGPQDAKNEIVDQWGRFDVSEKSGAVMEEIRQIVDGRLRRAKVVVPEGRGPWPVVLLLHGAGGNPEWALEETRFEPFARRHGLLVVAPEATRPDPETPARFFSNPPVWNDGSPFPPSNQVAHVDDVHYISSLLDEIGRRWPIDKRRVFVTGFSNGAAMTFRLGQALRHRLTAIASIAGHPPGPGPQPPLPTLFMIGKEDPLIPLEGGEVQTPWADAVRRPSVSESLARWAIGMGLPPEPSQVLTAGPIRRELWPQGWLEAWIIDGLGHHWPGGKAGLNRRIGGPATNIVDATRVIGEFFLRQFPEARLTRPRDHDE